MFHVPAHKNTSSPAGQIRRPQVAAPADHPAQVALAEERRPRRYEEEPYLHAPLSRAEREAFAFDDVPF